MKPGLGSAAVALVVSLSWSLMSGFSAYAQTGAVHGFVRDASDGEPLAYANVYLEKHVPSGIEGTGFGAATSVKGYFYIGRVPAGKYDLVASFVGHRTTRRTLSVSASQVVSLNLELSPGTVEMKEVRVTADRARFEREVEVSAVRLEAKQLQFIPRVGGEVDLFRTVQLLPGVIATSDFSNRLYIRGGSPDQNLILLDGITVYNPSHLFGMFSPFIADAVSDVTLLAGGFPAKYGGRLSSVLDVTTKEGNSKRYTGDASVSVIAAQGLVEGPIPGPKSEGRRTKDGGRAHDQLPIPNDSASLDSSLAPGPSSLAPSAKGSFLLAGRRTYLPDVLLKTFGVDGVGYYFYDLMGKANYEPWRDSRFTLTGLAAEDVLDFWDPNNPNGLKAKLAWGNRGISLRWNRVFTPILYGEILGAWSNFLSDFNVALGTQTDAKMATSLTDLTLKADLTWYALDRLTSDFGCDIRFTANRMSFAYDTTEFSRADSLWPPALHADAKWELVANRLFLKPGFRLAYYSQGRRLAPEPRIGLKWLPGKNTALSLAAGRFTQPLVTLNSTEAVFSIYDVWQSVPASRPLPSALHYIAGVEQWLGSDLVASLEGYYKDYANLLETRYGRFFTQPDSLLTADGYSCGADFMLRKTGGRVNGWLSYSYMWTRRSIGSEVYHPHYDRRHNANAVLNFPSVHWGVDVSAKWTLGTGLPYSGVVGYYPRYQHRPSEPAWPRMSDWEFIYGARDAFRYPVYHRLDAGLTRTWQARWGELSAFLDVTNLYNAKNVLLYYWEIGKDGLPVRKRIGMIPVLPTIGVKARF